MPSPPPPRIAGPAPAPSPPAAGWTATPTGGSDPAGTGPVDADLLASLGDLATDLARQAGALLMDGLGRARTTVDRKSTATDVVTEIDRASERLVTDGLRVARPGDGLLGEEGTAVAGRTGLRWVIDPLDGTTNYLYGHPGFGVSIAVEAHDVDHPDGPGRPVVGVVFDPWHDELFLARRGGGATRNGEPITCSTETDLGLALVATGFGYAAERRSRQARMLHVVLPRVRDIRRVGSAALDLCSVACGRIDAYYEQGLAHWDYAAGVLIAAEAGASVGHLHGGPPDGNLTMAASPALAAPLRALLDDAIRREM